MVCNLDRQERQGFAKGAKEGMRIFGNAECGFKLEARSVLGLPFSPLYL